LLLVIGTQRYARAQTSGTPPAEAGSVIKSKRVTDHKPIPIQPEAASAPAAAASKPPLEVEALEVRARPDVDMVAEGEAKMRQGRLDVRADRMSYDQASDTARASGHVLMTRDGDRYGGTELELQVQRFEGHFTNPTYFFSRFKAGGTAQRMDFLGPDVAIAHGATYTSCPQDGSQDPAWLLSTDEVKLDMANNEGIAKGAVLRFYGVPILAGPTLSFPLTDERKSGWLPPSLSLDTKSGVQLSVPYYWNIAPNRDATLTPTVISKRGAGLDTEFRYLDPNYEGLLNLNVLPNDRLAGETRGLLHLEHEGALPGDSRYSALLTRVTDDNYWKDFSRHLDSVTTPRLLSADLQAGHSFGDWTTYARVLRWQVLQDVDPASQIEAPYDRYPQLGLRGSQRIGNGMEFTAETEFNKFTNPDGYLQNVAGATPGVRPTGSRLHALGSLSWPLVTPGWSLVPKVSVNSASYSLDQALTQAGPYQGRTSLSRSIASVSLDSAWLLERDTNVFGHGLRQTLEPRLFYVKTQYRDQTGLPNFDSAEKDFNFDSIYTENSFSGVDRVSDSHQVTAGVTSRFLDPNTGSEALRLGIAQRFLLQDQQITADGKPDTQSVSDLLLLGSSSLGSKWKVDAGMQYSTDLHRTVRSLFTARYSPGPFRTISMGYRLKRDESEQVELAWQWPIYGPRRDAANRNRNECSGSWYSVGRINYSMMDSRVTDSVVGLEYDAGCWIGRVIAKRLSTGQQEATTQVGFELELVGLSRLGTNPLKVLKDNIPGYMPLRDDPAASNATRAP
jgi:LPS-assembly protein